MEVYPFHHQNLFFNIITDYDLTFKETREVLDYLLKMGAFSEGDDEFASGKFHDIRLGNVLYEVDVHRYEVVIYRRTELEG
ncbi:MAG TPA: hypothetical protein VEH09_04820 [Thermodesulfobacteriota bacterium]|jgi:hypothetical protein|nr:hypothetical protein [Thermodesulfobacteriota bacterium]